MLNKTELIDILAYKLGNTHSKAVLKDIIDNYNSLIIETLEKGEEINLKPLGKFTLKLSKGRTIKNSGLPWLQGKNYQSKKFIKIVFKASSLLKNRTQLLANKLETFNDSQNYQA